MSTNKKVLFKILNQSHSKEEINLVTEEKKFFIEKIWRDIERGKKAIRKQIEFDEISINNLIIKSPKIFKTQVFENESFQARMEYIEGHSGAEISMIGTREVSINIKDALSMIINRNFEYSTLTKVGNEIFIQKINTILELLKSDEYLRNKVNLIKKEFSKDNFLKIPCGRCHGDLTFSNIVISRTGSLNLIDFLPSFIESPIWDIVKLMQDIKYGWSYRYLTGPERATAKIFFLNCLPSQILMYEKVFKREILLFDALNLARLCPYLKDKETRDWLIKSLCISLLNLQSS